MKKLLKIVCIALVTGGLFFQSCETTELDLRTNPNALNPTLASPDLLLNGIQEDFARVIESLGRTGSQLVRIENMYGRDYRNVYTPAAFDASWEDAYTEILTDIDALTPLAQDAGLNFHLGMANFIEAYTITALVDFFGDVPYSEANQGAENFNPAVDPGADVYAAAFALLDMAQANFNATSAVLPQNDFFYRGNADQWIRAINTLRMKLYLQTRLADSGAAASFNAVVAGGNYITDPADDFQFSWGTNEVQPDTRHPEYTMNYTTTGGGQYMSNDLMNYMMNMDDPRIRYYFYRQNAQTPGAEAPPSLETLQCSLQAPPAHYAGFPFCALPNGYWGRDHGNDEGTPPDGFLRTLAGVYPLAGRFDDSTFAGQSQGAGGGGAGITPMLSASWADFYIAEFAMVSGNTVAARAAILDGLAKSVAKVISFGPRDPGYDPTFEPTQGEIDAHSDDVGNAFDSDGTGGWNTLGREFFTSLYGNGIDGYNFYRRTGFPSSLQPSIEPQPGFFIRSVFYSANFVNNNSSVAQKGDVTVQVFWDTNPSSPAFPPAN